ncbi:type II toxin-antitoxin system PemK/MazF family toxin [Methylocystis suflitae]|uniref:type II toxin-antitoxin system PemK/MazF family toxin n=1 Tax=Methylocystis suflitae TaxID=2951405 RepID=UPI002108D968|nr:type II toxin-antitoxin system PemK/MazF family toxin [Methylocystis suflitae]MCQ4188380.1 type II toxin-antitoxin system PemK/MazF family toxin [Methylocystis suflitae]
MEKDFDRWNGIKKNVHRREEPILFHEREIWWCALGANVGSEQDGVGDSFERPVLVIANFNNNVLWALPLTRTFKPNRFYCQLDDDEGGQSAVVLSQLRLISSKRLVRKIRTLDERQFEAAVRALKRLFPAV